LRIRITPGVIAKSGIDGPHAVAIIAAQLAFGVKWPIISQATFLPKPVPLMLPALNEPTSLPACSLAPYSASSRPTLAIRDLSRLMDEIRRVRVRFEPQDHAQPPADLEMVVGADPRD
jgi:hypothetical protein